VSRVKLPPQQLPWRVELQFCGADRCCPYFAIVDADGMFVADFGATREEPDFVCAVVNELARKPKRKANP
jgi:hypothetical protein